MKKETINPKFKTPEGYFENFEESIFLRIAEEKFPKQTGFTVPKNYFESFDDRILNRATHKKPKVLPLFKKQYLGYVAAIAACTVLLISIFNKQEISSADFNSIDSASISSYIEDGNLDVDIEDVMAILDTDELGSLDFQDEIFSQENLEEYLIQRIDDNDFINEE
ncbi:hypothetical protein [Aequorivita echinoideorum]|uniref:Uncharacterized protein n=1 Tax=Aequorivita echinoideorum TaxID=1549647 RepID=A0ABS5S4L6_9FLAO|nr:hypothetical protein [Aequorivita echinoideorum]MBT0608156.1 hypothetical protein [Aequorivita echinoideorum]